MPLPKSKIASDEIDEFLCLLNAGIRSWHAAGKKLIELRTKKPNVYSEIIRREPLITVDMLITLESVGAKKLHPRMLLHPSMPARRLIGFPYEEQARLCSEPIPLVVKNDDGETVIKKKLVRDMAQFELNRALDKTRVRTVKEQQQLLNHANQGNAAWKALSSKPGPAVSPKPALPNPDAAPPPTTAPGLIAIGRWIVRQTIGNNCGFERTTTAAHPKHTIILEDGIAVIEVCKRK